MVVLAFADVCRAKPSIKFAPWDKFDILFYVRGEDSTEPRVVQEWKPEEVQAQLVLSVKRYSRKYLVVPHEKSPSTIANAFWRSPSCSITEGALMDPGDVMYFASSHAPLERRFQMMLTDEAQKNEPANNKTLHRLGPDVLRLIMNQLPLAFVIENLAFVSEKMFKMVKLGTERRYERFDLARINHDTLACACELVHDATNTLKCVCRMEGRIAEHIELCLVKYKWSKCKRLCLKGRDDVFPTAALRRAFVAGNFPELEWLVLNPPYMREGMEFLDELPIPDTLERLQISGDEEPGVNYTAVGVFRNIPSLKVLHMCGKIKWETMMGMTQLLDKIKKGSLRELEELRICCVIPDSYDICRQVTSFRHQGLRRLILERYTNAKKRELDQKPNALDGSWLTYWFPNLEDLALFGNFMVQWSRVTTQALMKLKRLRITLASYAQPTPFHRMANLESAWFVVPQTMDELDPIVGLWHLRNLTALKLEWHRCLDELVDRLRWMHGLRVLELSVAVSVNSATCTRLSNLLACVPNLLRLRIELLDYDCPQEFAQIFHGKVGDLVVLELAYYKMRTRKFPSQEAPLKTRERLGQYFLERFDNVCTQVAESLEGSWAEDRDPHRVCSTFTRNEIELDADSYPFNNELYEFWSPAERIPKKESALFHNFHRLDC